jgi:hypothetical protein
VGVVLEKHLGQAGLEQLEATQFFLLLPHQVEVVEALMKGRD